MRTITAVLVLFCVMQQLPAQSYEKQLKMGIEAYDEGRYDDALQIFEKTVELQNELPAGHYWVGTTIYKMNPEAEDWPSQPHYQRVYELLRDKPVRRLNAAEKKYTENVCVYLALYSFNPGGLREPKISEVSCEAVKPYISRLLEVNPSNTQADDLLKFCKELNARESGRKKGREK